MSQASHPEAQSSHLQGEADKVILITSGLRPAKFAEDLREEMRHSGLDCQIVLGDVSDGNHIRKLIHDVLDCFSFVDISVNDAEIRRDLFIGKVTDEEWLAQ
jgi:NAD(P)-dependent dehydrogenase (short-subunit alcohol dehydrogenase family)